MAQAAASKIVDSKGKTERPPSIAFFDKNPDQLAAMRLCAGPQRHTLLVGGSRSGKTSLFVSNILVRAGRAPGSRHAILREHGNAARSSISLDTLPKVTRLRFPGLELTEHRQDGYFSLPNDSEIWVGGLDEKDRVDKILGKEYATVFVNECSQVSYHTILTVQTRLAQVVSASDGRALPQRAYYDLNPVGKAHWSNILFGDKRDPLTRHPLPDPENYARMFLNPEANAANLTKDYIRSLANLPERQRKRFYEGVYVDELDDALWTYELLEQVRLDVDEEVADPLERVARAFPLDRRRRCVVACDPSGASAPSDDQRDEIGIVVACLGDDGHGYVLADRSLRDSPAVWGRAVVKAYHDFGADTIVAEQNFGGEMVRAVILAADPEVGVKVMTASRGKSVRAEPVAALYEKRLVHHVGRLGVLEDQLAAFTTSGYRGEGSPDHADALVWAITELMLGSGAQGWIEYYSRLAAAQAESNRGDDAPAGTRRGSPPARVEPPSGTAVEAYKRTMDRIGNVRAVCAWCGEPLGGTRVTDGVDSYHEEPERWCASRARAAAQKVGVT